MPDRRHVVADRDRHDPDHAAARRHEDAARLGDAGRSRASRRRSSTSTATRSKVGGGYLAITRPWPAMLRTIWGDDERYVADVLVASGATGVYFPGDGAKRDKDGYFWLLGRVDDVMNVAGPPDRHDGGRVGAGRPPRGRRGRGRRRGRRAEGHGDRGLRHPEGEGQDGERARGRRSCSRRCAPTSRRRSARSPGRTELFFVARPAEDALGQDHAAPAARHRRGPGRSATRRRSPTPASSRR